MNLQLKSTAIIIGTLLVGMILGGLMTGMYHHRIADRISDRPATARFGMMMNRIIQPDETQAGQVKEVMDQYVSKFGDQRQKHGLEMKTLFDSLFSDLEPILTEEQFTRLKHMSQKRFSGQFRGRGKRDGHPGPPPPGEGF